MRITTCATTTIAPTYRIEVKENGRWMPAPGESSGWAKADAERAVTVGLPTVDGSSSGWEEMRLVEEENQK